MKNSCNREALKEELKGKLDLFRSSCKLIPKIFSPIPRILVP
jgi:hypothetical protein